MSDLRSQDRGGQSNVSKARTFFPQTQPVHSVADLRRRPEEAMTIPEGGNSN